MGGLCVGAVRRLAGKVFDWYVVAEIGLGVAAGIVAGGVVVVGLVRTLAYEILSNPTTRKLANAADKFAGKSGGGLLDSVMKLLGGGQA